jgi:hypothetical protein
MTPHRQRMLHELQRRNYSPSTIRGYLGAAKQFAEYFHRSPEQLGPDHLPLSICVCPRESPAHLPLKLAAMIKPEAIENP